ncbi:MAG: large repetitive protein, partial [Microbacteriaceae bacterium]|nr:large repetitive protein [Microbacteriaceae bacterium]
AAQPIIKSIIESNPTAPFRITGLIGDLALDANGAPVILGTPLLISGIAATATSVTYRYFLKDKNPNNTLGLFTGSGNVTITMIANRVASGPVGSPAYNGAQNLTLAVTAGTVGEATVGGPISLGPLTLQGPTVGLGGFGFADGKVLVSVTVGVQRASLAFGGNPTTGAQSTAQTNSGVTVDLIGLMGSFELAVDVFGLLGGNVDVRLTGKWGLQVASLDAQIPNVARLQATGIKVNYDPKGAADQEIVRINTATISFPSFGITGSLRPYDPAASSNISANNDQVIGVGVIPGLTVYGDGFRLGTAELAYGLPPAYVTDPANTLSPGTTDKKITFGGILELDDIRVGISGFEVRFPSAGAPSTASAGFTGLIYIASGGARLFPGKTFGATITDRVATDDRRPDGTPDDEAFRIALTFQNGKVDAFQLTVDTLEIRLGTYVSLTARDFRLDTGATGSQIMVQFQAAGAKVTVGSLVIAGEGRNFAITGDGSFKALPGFGVFLSIGSATGDSFKWPSFLPVRLDSIGIQWTDVEKAPEDFVLILSASVTGIQGLSGLEISGAVQGIRIQPSLLLAGEFPIIGIDSIGVTVKGTMFGGEVSAGLIGGILKLDSNYSIIGVFDTTTPVRQRVFYLGLAGTISIAGMAGFGIRIGLSELGPLQVYLSVSVPGGILLEPVSGLTINDFAGGVEFFKTLPSIEDPLALRSSAFQLPTVLSADEWLLSLQQQVAVQAKTISQNPGQSGFAAAFSAPMVITGSAKIYSIYTSQSVFNGQVTVKISTDGKILIVGTLNFASDKLSISGRLYADLSKVASGTVVVLFLADFPDQVRLLTLYGKLKMGFRNSSGQEVTFDVVEGLDPIATGTAPQIDLGAPTTNGGTVDVGVVNGATGSIKFLDVSYTPPAGASLDFASILDVGLEFTLWYGTTQRTTVTGKPVPIVAVTTAGGMKFVELLTDATGAYYLLDGTRVNVLLRADLAAGADLLEMAVRITGTTRFRYSIGTAALDLGRWELRFAAGATKNADLTTDAGTTTGAGSAARTLAFTVTGATATVTNPTPGASVDVNVLNGRAWIDVTFTNPTLFTIDPASIIDLAPEFQLSGLGLGTIQLDGTQAPISITAGVAAGTLKFRYWLTGRFATAGAVNLTFLSGSWSYLFAISGAVTVTDAPEVPLGTNGLPLPTPIRTTVGILFPVGGQLGLPAGFTVDPDSVISRLGGLSFGGSGWTVAIDPDVAITATETPGEFRIGVIVRAFGAAGTLTAALAASTLGYRGTVIAGSQPGQTATITPTAYLDVDFDSTVGGYLLDLASILDLAPEFELVGDGLGSIVLDNARAPVQLTGAPAGKARFRFWLSGQYEVGFAVTLTRLAGTWSYATTVTPTAATVVAPGSSLVWGTDLVVTFPAGAGANAGFVVDPASVIDRLGALAITATADGWTVVRDTTRGIRQGSGALQFLIPVLVERAGTTAASSAITLGATAVSYANAAAPSSDVA